MYEITESDREKIDRITTYMKTIRTLEQSAENFDELQRFYIKEINTLFSDLGMQLYWTIKEQM